MFFPIGDANIKHGHKAFFTYLIIAANIAVFAMQFMMPNDLQQRFVMDYGCIPNELMQFKQWHTVITSMFLHGGVMHLLDNMLFMWVFADNIEATIGNFKFLLFYLAGGLVATLTHVFFNAGSEVPCVGASGAIAACLGAYLVMFPHSKIKIFFILFLTSFNVSFAGENVPDVADAPTEESCFIPDISMDDACALAEDYGQLAIVCGAADGIAQLVWIEPEKKGMEAAS